MDKHRILESILNVTTAYVNTYTGNNFETLYIPKEADGQIFIKGDDNNFHKLDSYDLNEISDSMPDEECVVLTDKTKRLLDFVYLKKLNATIESLPLPTEEEQKVINLMGNKNSFITAKEDIKNEKIKKQYSSLINDILNTIKYPARSDKKGEFYETTKLEVLKAYVEKIPGYNLIHESNKSLIFGKATPKKGDNIISVSSHADIVKQITKVSSVLKEDKKIFHGTYDNLGTNAALIYLMITSNLPDNVIFAFTADEETGKCAGAKDVLDFVNETTGSNPELAIALDVTDEGFDDKILSFEGLSCPEEQHKKIRDAMMLTEGKKESFCVVRAKRKDESLFPKSYVTDTTTMYDESAFYAKEKQNTISICVPSDGVMHGNAGLDIKESTFVGYMLSLQFFLQNYTRDHELTKKELDMIEEIKSFKDYLTRESEATKVKSESTYFHNFSTYDWGYDDFDYDYSTPDPDMYISQMEEDLNNLLGCNDYDTFEEFKDDAESFLGIDGDESKEALRSIWNEFHGLGYDEDEEEEEAEEDTPNEGSENFSNYQKLLDSLAEDEEPGYEAGL